MLTDYCQKNSVSKKRIGARGSGFTLVEVLVAAVLVSLSVFAVVAVVNTGTMLETSNNNRRQARAIIRSVFEQNYDFVDYKTIPDSAILTENIVIDERHGVGLNGTQTTRVFIDSAITGNNIKVLGKRVSITCSWVEANGVGDSIVLSKIVTDARQ